MIKAFAGKSCINAHTGQLYRELKRANTEAAKKERFIKYLTTCFPTDKAP